MLRTRWYLLLVPALLLACGEDPDGVTSDPAPQEAPEPPPEEPSDGPVTVPADDPDGGDATLDLVVDPEEVAADGEVVIAIRNDGGSAIGVGREHHVERWDGSGWERLAWPQGHGWTDDLPLVEPGEELRLGTWPPDDASFEAPGWYRATTTVPVQDVPEETTDDEGRLVVYAPFLVTD